MPKKASSEEIEDEDLDYEEIWDGICRVAARPAGVSAGRAKAILADAGHHAYGHTGIVEAVEVVVAALHRHS